MHRRLFVLSILLLAACAPQAVPVTPPTVPAVVASDTPAAPVTSALPASPTDTLVPPTLTFTPTVTEIPALPTTPVAIETTAAPGADLTPQPGLIIRGYVRLADGTGVADVSICRNYASYPGTIVAKTDANGYFESQFAFIPGDEMVGVWPQAAGYSFQPDNYRWRHYYGSEDRSLEFVATLSMATAAAPFPCQ